MDVESIEIPPHRLQGLVGVPPDAGGIVIFAHGSGSGRLSPRNRRVAAALRAAGLATLLLDLLTPAEEGDRTKVFDIPLLADRLHDAARWAHAHPATSSLRQGLFGASTGGGAALVAAARPGNAIAAVVSRGGRPDLAGDALPMVVAPTLLIVGALDTDVVRLNEHACGRLACEKELVIVSGAGHLFEEPGTLDVVVRRSTEWFLRFLAA